LQRVRLSWIAGFSILVLHFDHLEQLSTSVTGRVGHAWAHPAFDQITHNRAHHVREIRACVDSANSYSETSRLTYNLADTALLSSLKTFFALCRHFFCSSFDSMHSIETNTNAHVSLQLRLFLRSAGRSTPQALQIKSAGFIPNFVK
jgi:hypothetical protein